MTDTEASDSDTAALAPALLRALNADTMPRPLLRSVLDSSMSIVPLCSAERIFAWVMLGTADLMSAATAPAWGAAAEVPKNGFSPEPPGSVVLTPSVADRSGLARLTPPLLANVRPGFAGLIGLLNRSKKIRRGPSELNSSIGVVGPGGNSPPLASAASTAPTANASVAELCP